MRVTYISIHRVKGVIGLPNDAPVILFDNPKAGTRATLTMTREPYFLHLRRLKAYGLMIAQTLVQGSDDSSDLRTRFARAFESSAIAEGADFDKPLLIVEVVNEIEDLKLDAIHDVGECSFGPSLFDTKPISDIAELALESAVAGISLVLPPATTSLVTRLGHVSFATHPSNDRFFYSHEVSISDSRTTMTSLSEDSFREAGNIARKLTKTRDLKTVVHLLSRSLRTTDDLQAFLTAWAGIEVFLTKSFKSTYEQQIYDTLSRATSVSPFISRIRNVMSGKYNIQDKFVVVSSALDPHNADPDIKIFKSLKHERDSIHEMKIRVGGFSTTQTQDLLRKYLRLHLLSIK